MTGTTDDIGVINMTRNTRLEVILSLKPVTPPSARVSPSWRMRLRHYEILDVTISTKLLIDVTALTVNFE